MNLLFASLMFGKQVAAKEAIRRHRIKCRETGGKYDRRRAIEDAAKHYRLDPNTLENWMGRSKLIRDG